MANRQKGFSLIELLIVVAIILIISAIAVPNLLRAKIAANEASAVGSLRALNTAAIAYSTTYGAYPPTITALGPNSSPSSTAADLVDSLLADGVKSGYSFSWTPGTGNWTYAITATPISVSTGQRSFYTDQSGVIRATTTGTATVVSNPLQ